MSRTIPLYPLYPLYGVVLLGCFAPEDAVEEDNDVGQMSAPFCTEEQAFPNAAGNNLWPGGIIPYVWDSSNPPNASQMQQVLAEMSDWEAATGDVVQFVPRTTELHYAKIDATCGAGAQNRGEVVVVSQLGGCTGWTLTHEMGHLVGLSHHAQHRERDRYLIVAPGVPGGYGGTPCDPNDPVPMQHGVLSRYALVRPYEWLDDPLEDYNYRYPGAFDFDSIMLYGGGGPNSNYDPGLGYYTSPACGAYPAGDRSYVRRGIVDVAPNPPCESDVYRGSGVSTQDASTTIELYRSLAGWAPFRLIGFDKTAFEPPAVELAPGVNPVGAPAVASVGTWASTNTPLVMTFARGSDGKIYGRGSAFANFANTWSALPNPPGAVTSDPAAVSWSQSTARIDVVAVSGTNVVKIGYHGGAWESAWSSLGAPAPGVSTSAGPAIASWGTNRLDVFVRGNDGHIWQKSWNGSAWSSWTRPRPTSSGVVAASTRPAAVSWGANRIDLVIRADTGALRHLPFTSGAWAANWIEIGSAGSSGQGSPAAAAWGSGRLDVFVRGNGSNSWLWQKACTTSPCTSASSWPSSFTNLGGILVSDPAASSPRATGVQRIDVVARHQDDNIDPTGQAVAEGIWHKWWPWNSWPVWAQSKKADFDGDRETDMSVWRPSSGNWWVRYSTTQAIGPGINIGQSGDSPLPGDFDGDGEADMSVWRPSSGLWWVRTSSTGTIQPGVAVGQSGDVPVPGDYDGDGRTDMAVFRPSTGAWHIRYSSTESFGTAVIVGQSGDVPVAADFDGDGKVDMSVWRPSTGNWWVRESTTGVIASGVNIGQFGDFALAGDFDGDGKADMSVWRPSSGLWWVRSSVTGQIQSGVSYGQSTDLPTPADYDGDGRTDMSLWDPNTGGWTYIASSTSTQSNPIYIGQYGDIPVVRFGAASLHR